MKKGSAMVIACYLTIYFVWGSTYFFIKMAVETIPPFYVLGFRFLIGGILFFVVSLAGGRMKPFPKAREILSALVLGTLLLLVANGLVTVAEKQISSYIVALVLASTPIFVAFFNRCIFKMPISPIRLAGILIGVIGVGFLLYDGQSVLPSIKPEVLMVFGALVSWSFATSLGHRLKVYKDSFVNSSIQMFFVGAVSFAGVTIGHSPLTEIIQLFSLRSMIGVLYLALIGSLAFSAYNYLLSHEPSIRIVSYAFVNPVIAVFIGILIGNEKIVPYLFIGLPFVLLGLFLMFYGEFVLHRIRGKPRDQ